MEFSNQTLGFASVRALYVAHAKHWMCPVTHCTEYMQLGGSEGALSPVFMTEVARWLFKRKIAMGIGYIEEVDIGANLLTNKQEIRRT